MFIPLHDDNALKNIRLQFVTLFLIFLNTLVWWLVTTEQFGESIPVASVFYSFGFIPAVVGDLAELPTEVVIIPEYANYLSYAFFHGGFLHLAGNMLFLWVFGDNVEDAMGHFRFLVFYMICAIVAAWAHYLVVPDSRSPLIGASGAAAGVVGAYLMLHPKVKVWVLALGRIPLRLPAIWLLAGWFAFQVFNLVVTPDSEISWAAHVGGFIAGVLLVIPFKQKSVQLFDRGLETPVLVDSEAVQGSPSSIDSDHKWGRE